MTDELWNEFFASGWEYGKTPTKRECFDAGVKAALKKMQPETKKTPYEIIKEWQDKFEASEK